MRCPSPRTLVIVSLVVGAALELLAVVDFTVAWLAPPSYDIVPNRELIWFELADGVSTFGLSAAGLVVLAVGVGVVLGVRASQQQ